MAILHTPRTLASIARGLLRRRRQLAAAAATGGETANNSHNNENHNTHVYHGRASWLWDLDYLGHANNASYLTHAEYARWEWTAETGILSAMLGTRSAFVVTQTAVRFRKEITARNNAFEIHSKLVGIDGTHLWMSQDVRSPKHKDKDKDKDKHPQRIMAQVAVRGVVVRDKAILPPATLLGEVGVPDRVLGSLLGADSDPPGNDNDNDNESVMARFRDLDDAFRHAAADDDKRLGV
eukprot:jgi/Psemu1/265049/estExt_Genewise1Plus.C_31120001